MLLAEELALVAVSPETGRPEMGTRERLNACLAGLLVAELLLAGAAGPGERDDRVVLTGEPPSSVTLAAAVEVIGEKGPKIHSILSNMSRGLQQRLGVGTWDAAMAGLVEAGVLRPSKGGLLARHDLVDPGTRDQVVARLATSAGEDGPIDVPTSLVLTMTGPATSSKWWPRTEARASMLELVSTMRSIAPTWGPLTRSCVGS